MFSKNRLCRTSLAAVSLIAASLTCSAAFADTTYSMRSYFDSLPPIYPSQSTSSRWTFHAGTSSGTLIAPLGENYYGPEQYQQIGSPVDAGTSGCTSGFCPGDPANTLATFNGSFVHPGSGTPTTAVFRVQEDMAVTEIKLWSEMVGNGNNGNGIDVTVRAIVGGLPSLIGTFAFDYLTTRTAKDEHIYTPGLLLHNGDLIEFVYGNNASNLYDHGNVEVFVTTGILAAPVPEPETYATLLAGLGLLAFTARRRSKTKTVA